MRSGSSRTSRLLVAIMASVAEEREKFLLQQIVQTREDIRNKNAALTSVRAQIDVELQNTEAERMPGRLVEWKAREGQLQTELVLLHSELRKLYELLTPGTRVVDSSFC